MKTRKIVLFGILTAVAFALSYIESLIPTFFAVPGIKLGLSNLVVIIVLYLVDIKTAVIINVIRIILASFLFGNLMSLAYSFAGAALSMLIMVIMMKTKHFHTITISIAGGVFHNVGQIIVAIIVLGTTSLAWYLLVLWCTGIAAGAVIGIIGGILIGRLRGLFDKYLKAD